MCAVEVCRPKTEGLIPIMYGVAQVMRRPSSLILKQSYRPNPSFCAEVKPMSGAKGNTNHVTAPDLDAKNGLVTWVDVIEP